MPLVAWYASHRLKSLRFDVPSLYDNRRTLFDDIVKNPGGIGWRAEAELADWMESETHRRADNTGKDFDQYDVKTSGCLTDLRVTRARSVTAARPIAEKISTQRNQARGRTRSRPIRFAPTRRRF